MSGCVTTYPRNEEDQAAHHASEARVAFRNGDCLNAALQIDVALIRPTGNAKIKELLSLNPKMQDCYFGYLEKKILDVSDAHQAATVFDKLATVRSSGVLSENQMSSLFGAIGKAVTDGNISGSVPFVLGDITDNFPQLNSESHQQIMVNRSIANLQRKGLRIRPVRALMDYAGRLGTDSVEGRRIESLLPTMNIRRDEIEFVAKVFPMFAAVRKDEISTRVLLQVKNGDRLFAEDLRQALSAGIRGIDWVSVAGPRTITLAIERVRNDEKVMPEQSQTITYAQHEVDTLNAVLLMPRNASYIYEIIAGGAEIEYGYVVSAKLDDKMVHDEVIRGTVKKEYRRCQNSRIQNVFGGTSSARFEANDDMRRRCSGQGSASIEALRQEVLSKIVDGVVKVPPINVVQDLY